MVIISRPNIPFIPEQVTVHLGEPDEPAENVTVSFPSYIKNVASSEIYPTWPESAIRANIYAQISFALNRIYTEWYRSRGYDFDITNSIDYDQSYIPGRDIYENISVIVDEIFNSYVARQGYVEPLLTSYCDGRTSTCSGLQQWDTVKLAASGYSPLDILKYYYGSDINIIGNVPVGTNFESYPLYPLRIGSFGRDVSIIQHELNRISRNYPSISQIISDSDGIFGMQTDTAVKQFQKAFNLPVNGVIDSATWYKIKYIYSAVKGLGELFSEGLPPQDVESTFQIAWQEGDSGIWVKIIQFYVHVLACYYTDIPQIEITGYFGPETADSVMMLQKKFNLIVDGVVGIQTWALLDSQYKTIKDFIPEGCLPYKTIYPGYILSLGMGDQNVTLMQVYLSKLADYYHFIPKVNITGIYDQQTEEAVWALQQQYLGELGEPPRAVIGPITWGVISELYESLPKA